MFSSDKLCFTDKFLDYRIEVLKISLKLIFRFISATSLFCVCEENYFFKYMELYYKVKAVIKHVTHQFYKIPLS